MSVVPVFQRIEAEWSRVQGPPVVHSNIVTQSFFFP